MKYDAKQHPNQGEKDRDTTTSRHDQQKGGMGNKDLGNKDKDKAKEDTSKKW